MVINANPRIIKIPRFSSDVMALNNKMAPINPRNNVAVPWMTISKDTLGVISGKKAPASNTKIATK